MRALEILKQEAKKGEQLIGPKDPRLQYEGRIDFEKEAGPLWTYPATSVRIRFRGTRLDVVVSNYRAYWDNFLGYILDGEEYCVKLPDSGVARICLYAGERESLGAGGRGEGPESGMVEECRAGAGNGTVEGCGTESMHEVLLFKRQDSCHMMQIHGFLGSSDLELLPCASLPFRRIEVYGDSVSAGEVSEAVAYCGQPDPVHNGEYSNSYYSYAWLTARKLGARLHDIAQGGIALQDGTGYFMEPEQKGMEYIFDKVQYQPRILENSPIPLGAGETGEPLRWDFSLYRPQVVIVALGQNDAHPRDFCGEDYEGEQAAAWRERYGAFVRRLRAIHPRAHIICMTTILNHHENWDRSIEEVCAGLGDERVHHFLFGNNGRGTHGHIRKPEAERMAEELSAYIEALGEDIWRDTERLENVFARAEKGEPLTIGFLGGSITQGSLASRQENCYASLVFRWWQERFPRGKFTCVNGGIGGTTSHFGAARVEEDLLYARPDVVFVEFSVNDEDEAHFEECYEGLIRHILGCEWKPAVVLLHNRFYSDGHSAQRVHDRVGRHYGLPRVCMGDVIYPRIQTGELSAEEITPDGLHPNDRGHALLAGIITEKLGEAYEAFRKRGLAGEALGDLAAEALGGMAAATGEAAKVTGEAVEPMGKYTAETAVEAAGLPVPITLNRYENTRRLRNDTIQPVSCRGFSADHTIQSAITETFRKGWTAGQVGDEICFEAEGRCIALQYRRTVSKPAPKALAYVDDDREHGIVLDGNFDQDWGDCLALQVLLEDSRPGLHRITVRITEAEDVATPFYLVSVIVA